MKSITAFLQLIRWPNLLFIIIGQWAFYFFVLQPIYNTSGIVLGLDYVLLTLLVFASVCIAAAGYIINDYFDVNIDRLNKPEKLVIEKKIKRRSAIILHFVLSFVGVCISFYVSAKLHQKLWWLGFCNFGVVILLVLYSASLKKKLLVGNILIAALTAWVFIVIILTQVGIDIKYNGLQNAYFGKMFRIGILYASFAFILTLMREIVKDMEDYIGDIKYGCKTMPIVWGFPVSKVFVAVWTIVLIGMLTVLQFYVLQYEWYIAILYCLILVIVPLVFSLKVLAAAFAQIHYHTLSNIYKFVMLTGILSMLFFKIYA
jgi:4-hydroxybenzoate polyprenyltransferase